MPNPSPEEQARPEVVALVGPAAKRVLDVNCATGALGAALKARGVAEIVGMERDPRSAAVARKSLGAVLEADLESRPVLPYPDGYFDVIVCAGILERLSEPAAALRHLRRWLAPGGHLVCSFSNLRHQSVLLPLLVQGHWDLGLRQGFTLSSVQVLLTEAGLAVDGEVQGVSTPPSPQLARLAGAVAELGGDGERFVMEARATHFLLVARPKSALTDRLVEEFRPTARPQAPAPAPAPAVTAAPPASAGPPVAAAAQAATPAAEPTAEPSADPAPLLAALMERRPVPQGAAAVEIPRGLLALMCQDLLVKGRTHLLEPLLEPRAERVKPGLPALTREVLAELGVSAEDDGEPAPIFAPNDLKSVFTSWPQFAVRELPAELEARLASGEPDAALLDPLRALPAPSGGQGTRVWISAASLRRLSAVAAALPRARFIELSSSPGSEPAEVAGRFLSLDPDRLRREPAAEQERLSAFVGEG